MALLNERYGVTTKLIKGSGGVYELKLNDEPIWSKKSVKRFPTDEEVFEALDARLPKR